MQLTMHRSFNCHVIAKATASTAVTAATAKATAAATAHIAKAAAVQQE